jgi:hypothetical protein
MRILRLLAASTCLVAAVSLPGYLSAPWHLALVSVGAAGAIASVIVMRRDREDQGLDKPPSIL